MKIDNKKVNKWLNNNNINYISDFDISKRSWLKAGGVVKIFITPKDLLELKKIINFFKFENLKFYILGNISNTILRDGIILTPIINLNKIDHITQINNENDLNISVGAGVSIPRFANFVMKKSYSGTEGLLGIPGSIGGGIFMNASCYGDELTEFVTKIKSINSEGEVFTRNKNEAKFNWRDSLYQYNNEIITDVEFLFPNKNHKNIDEIRNKSEKIKFHRKKIQENDHPNLGSLFATKNLYSEIKFISIKYFLLYLFYKFFLIIINNNLLIKMNILIFRKKINLFYRKILNINENCDFSLSDKTINCLINKGTQNSQNAIKLVRHLHKTFKKKIRLENIILDNIE